MTKLLSRTFMTLVGWFFVSSLVGCAGSQPSARIAPALKSASRDWSVFKPRPPAIGSWIDYGPLDVILNRIVIDTGMSLRKRMPPVSQITGTRILRANSSPLRTEGNKVTFSRLGDEGTEILKLYTDALIRTADQVDITQLPRNEQLAYWFNLHNLIVVTEIAKHYPVRRPAKLEIGPDDVPLHEAHVVTINGVPLSLRDIRENIVQRYWTDPRVMYGFFHGDLASPNLLPRAWRASNLNSGLDANAREFVNALRGVDRRRGRLRVSPLYRDAKDQLFPNWPVDFREHLSQFAGSAVRDVLARTDGVEFARREDRTADLIGGAPQASFSRIDGFSVFTNRLFVAFGPDLPIAAPTSNVRLAQAEIARKLFILKLRGLLEKRVDIEDGPFDGRSAEVIQ